MKTTAIHIGESLTLTLWVGGMWFGGYVVAPLLFQYLDRVTAGMVAGHVFAALSYIGLFCGLFLLSTYAMTQKDRLFPPFYPLCLVVMLALVEFSHFLLTPMMADLKAAGIQEGSENAVQFARLHGISSILFLISSVLGLYLVVTRGRQSG